MSDICGNGGGTSPVGGEAEVPLQPHPDPDDGEECGICFDQLTAPVTIRCGHSFCNGCLDGWRSKYGSNESSPLNEEDPLVWEKGCPICRQKLPPTKEMVAQLESSRLLMEYCKDKGDEEAYLGRKAEYESLKAKIGDYDEDDVIGDKEQYSVELTDDMVDFVKSNDIRSVVNWIGVPADKKRLEAGFPTLWHQTMLHIAATGPNTLPLMSVLLQLGANVNALDAKGGSPFEKATLETPSETLRTCKLLLEWGAEIPDKPTTVLLLRNYNDDEVDGYREGYHEVADLLSTELGGRRCEIIGMQNRIDLNGKTCVVERYVKQKGRYRVVLESSKEVFAVKPKNLKRRDRTPEDCGYYIELKRGDNFRHGYAAIAKEESTLYFTKALVGTSIESDNIFRYDFSSKEECQAFVKEVNADGWVPVETKGERAVRELSDDKSQKTMKEFRRRMKEMDKLEREATDPDDLHAKCVEAGLLPEGFCLDAFKCVGI